MIILADYGFPFHIDDVSNPISIKHCWFYDSELNDFLLRPIRLLEETTGPTVKVQINQTIFDVPASWNLLVVDEDTKLVDTVQITQCSSSNYQAFLMHPDLSRYILSPVILLDLEVKKSCVHVMIPRMHMMLHPVGQIKSDPRNSNYSYSCLLSPQDVGKHMSGMTAMEVLI